MIVTVFRSRLNADSEVDYKRSAARMSALAKTIPGYI
jgi:antibiotic biosynthesis monooxygenase (ABM) superfamily enzyme